MSDKIRIQGVHINVAIVASENKSLKELSGKYIFPEGPEQAASYEALWAEVEKYKVAPAPVKISIEREKPVKKK